jgi:hypothetical protein
MEKLNEEAAVVPQHAPHPVELFARAYGIEVS